MSHALFSQPCGTALTMSIRPVRPSLRIALALCASMVLTLRFNWAAISLLL